MPGDGNGRKFQSPLILHKQMCGYGPPVLIYRYCLITLTQQEVIRIGVAHLSNVSGFRLQLYLSVGTGNLRQNSLSERSQSGPNICDFHGCTFCSSKEEDSRVLLQEHFTQDIILHVFFRAIYFLNPCLP